MYLQVQDAEATLQSHQLHGHLQGTKPGVLTRDIRRERRSKVLSATRT